MSTLCVTSTGKDFASEVDDRFGRCPYLLFIDDTGKIVEAIENPNSTGSGAGIATAQLIADKKAKIVITQKVGPKAMDALMSLGIEVFQASGLIKDVFENFKKNTYEKITSANTSSHAGTHS